MEKKPVGIELSASKNNSFDQYIANSNNLLQRNKNYLTDRKDLKYIIIGFIVLAVIIAFILILVFVIIKDKKDKDKDKIPIIMDLDEGGDDLIAYTIANNSRKYDILGVTTVSPEYYIDNVTDVILRFLEYMNFDVKVYKGENHPLVRKTSPADFYHDYGVEFPKTTKIAETKHAVDFMYDTIKNHKKKVTLFLLAPLTNFAKVIQRDGTIIKKIEEIIIMGGTKSEGNMDVNPKAEYNIYVDAEAADIVFNCGAKVKVMGTDVTHKVEFTDEVYERYRKMNTRSSNLTYFAMKGNFLTWGQNYLHDPVTVLYHLNKNIITLKKYNVIVNTTNPDVNGTNYGTMDFIEPVKDINGNIEYSESINLNLYWKTLDEYLKKY